MAEQAPEKISTGYFPRPLQAELHKRLLRFNVLVMHRRFGKRCDVSTPIPTPSGFIKLGEVKTGDLIYGHDGKATKVLEAHPIELATDCFDVEFDCKESIRADAEHLWYVEPLYSKAKPHLRDHWKCGEVINTSRLYDLVNDGVSLFIPVAKPVLYSDSKVVVDHYNFGLWLGDGSKNSCVLTNPNKNILSSFAEMLHGFGVESKTDFIGHEKYCTRLTNVGSSKPFLNELRRLGVYENKHIPDSYKISSPEQRAELIQGLMDSDGTVSDSGACVFYNKNERLIDDVVEVLSSMGIKAHKTFYDRDGSKEFMIHFSSWFNPFKLDDRNGPRFTQRGRRAERHKVVSVKKAAPVKMRCLTVDDEKSVFLIGKHFIPTHNTVFSINEMIDRGLRNQNKNPQYAYFAPFYGQAKRVAWDYLKDYTRNIPGVRFNEAELRVEIPRPALDDKIRFILLGADNPAAIRGIYLDGAILDEYAEMDPTVWGQVIRPTLSDREGWAIFIGTPKGQNHFHEIYDKARVNPRWLAVLCRASDTNIIPKYELEAAKAEMAEEEYLQEYECSFVAALIGSYYGKYMGEAEAEGRITTVPYDPALLVDTYWDLGVGDTTAIWFLQQQGKNYHLIDYVEDSGKGLEFYVKEIQSKRYAYGYHTLPHDAAARSMESGRTRQQVLQKLGLKALIQKRQSVEDGINAARLILSRCWFDKEKCARGLAALKNYERKWDPKNKMFHNKPKHNWASHASDAFRYLALGVKEDADDNPILPREAQSEYNVFSRDGRYI